MVKDIKNRLSKLERKVKKDNLTTIKEISKLKDDVTFERKKNKKEVFFKVVSYLFLFLLLIIALNQFFKWEFVTPQMTRLVILAIVAGGLTFWYNKDKTNFDLDKEKRNEELKEKKRKREFSSKFPKINKIPILRNFVKWIYKEGWKYTLVLVVILIILFSLYIYNISAIKFIDTDESRLFYDAQQITEGEIPFRDFNARSPFIIYFLAGFIFLFGNSLFSLYLLAILLVIILIILIYSLTSKLFNKKIGVITILIFGLAPIMINLLHIKTQTFQLPLIFLSFILYQNYLSKKRKIFLNIIFLIMICALFSRPSSVFFIPLFFILAFTKIKDKKKLYRESFKLVILFTITILIFFVVNNLFFSYGDEGLVDISKLSLRIDNENRERLTHAPFYFSKAYMLLLLLSIPYVIFSLMINKSKTRENLLFPLAGFIILFFVYLFQILTHGFWPQYIMEFAPFYSMMIGLFIFILLKEHRRKTLKIILAIIIITLIVSFNIPSYIYMKEYMGVNPLDGSTKISKYITENSNEKDIIFGGNPIYSFLSGREHFMNLSHTYYEKEDVEKVLSNMKKNPPKFIIVDRYIEANYDKNEEFKEFLRNNYEEVLTFQERSYGKSWKAIIYKRLVN